jgi:hypothetical protein
MLFKGKSVIFLDLIVDPKAPGKAAAQRSSTSMPLQLSTSENVKVSRN